MLYRADDLKRIAKAHLGFQKSAAIELRNAAESASPSSQYHIFLSHSFADKEVVAGLKYDWESMGYRVYVDWTEDPYLSRENVNKETAEKIRQRMKQCDTLFFATSTNSGGSKWMPWELGYFDALKTRVAICPIASNTEHDFRGQEYLGLYPYVQKTAEKDTDKQALWIHESETRYIHFDAWRIGRDPYQR